MIPKVCKPNEIDPDKRIGLIIEQDDDMMALRPINMFGGIISEYSKDNPATVIVPVIIGDITPGMLMSYLSAITSCAVSMLTETDIPKDMLRDLLQLAINEGMNNKPITYMSQN